MNIATTIATSMIGAAVKRVLERDSVPVANRDVGKVTSEVTRELAPLIVNQTNNEPWYQSRVTLGSLFAGLAATGNLGLMFARGDFDVELVSVSLTTLLGIGFALYGRWTAKKPLGQ